MMDDRNGLARAVCDVARRAGAAILEIYATDFEVRGKEDLSPVTEADEAAERLILAKLSHLTPEIPVVGEESVAAGRVPDVSGGVFWLVDPLDGTKEFIRRNGEFSVNIALVEGALPTLGVVGLPALGELYWTAGGGTAWRSREGGADERIAARVPDPAGLVAVVSRSHADSRTDDYLAQFSIRERIAAGSAMKLCHVARGDADIYPRLGRTMEWDIAAGHAVLLAAGGTVTTLAGEPLTYGKPGFENPEFVARGRTG